MDKEVEAFKQFMFEMCWYMRGGVSIEQIYSMDIADHGLISNIIKKNLETTKESGMPFF